MKTKFILLSVLLGAGLIAGTSVADARGFGGRGSGQGQAQRGSAANPNRAPKRDGSSGSQQNPTRQPKKDGTGGVHKPANPDCPQDGSSPRPRG